MHEPHHPNEPPSPPAEIGHRPRPDGRDAPGHATPPVAPGDAEAAPGEGTTGWTIRRKLQVSFGLMILLIAVLGGMGISSISRLRDITTVLSDQDLLLTRTASSIQFGLIVGRVNRLMYTDRGDAQAFQVAMDTMKRAQEEGTPANNLPRDSSV